MCVVWAQSSSKRERKNQRNIQRPRWIAEAFEIVYLYTRIQWDALGAILIWFEPIEVIASERAREKSGRNHRWK